MAVEYVPPYGTLCRGCRHFWEDVENHKPCPKELLRSWAIIGGRDLRFYITFKKLGIPVQDGTRLQSLPSWYISLYDSLNHRFDGNDFAMKSVWPLRKQYKKRRREIVIAMLREALAIRGGAEP